MAYGVRKKTSTTTGTGEKKSTTATYKRKGVGPTAGERPSSTKIGQSGTGTYSASDAGGSGGGGAVTAAGIPTGQPGAGGTAALSSSTRTGFGNSFAPNAYSEAWANPEAVIRQWFNHRNLPTNTGYEAMLQELQPSLGIQFLAANNQADKTVADLDSAHYLDYTGEALRQGGQAGGRSLGVEEMLGALLDPQSSILKDHLGNSELKASDQVTNMLSAARYGLSPSLPTPVLNALLNQINDAGKDYQASMLTNPEGQKENFSQILAGLGLL